MKAIIVKDGVGFEILLDQTLDRIIELFRLQDQEAAERRRKVRFHKARKERKK